MKARTAVKPVDSDDEMNLDFILGKVELRTKPASGKSAKQEAAEGDQGGDAGGSGSTGTAARGDACVRHELFECFEH